MDFDIATQWPAVTTAVGWLASVIWLYRMLATGKLHTHREFQDREAEADARVVDLKEAHAREIKQKDEEIVPLRATNKVLADAVALQSKTQEASLQTADIVKTVMQNLQAQARGNTGPVGKVNQGADQ